MEHYSPSENYGLNRSALALRQLLQYLLEHLGRIVLAALRWGFGALKGLHDFGDDLP